MAPPLLSLRDIHLTFGGTPLLEGAELFASPGERIVLVGRNGSGKSTLLKIAAGLIEADRGERFVSPGATIHYLPQEPDLSAFPTALDAVLAALGPADDVHRARFLLETLGLTGAEAPGTLSGGEARRVALARALAPEPDVLLLDEPTNHLDLPAIEWLEGELKSLRSAIVLISHDRRFLEALSRATVWLDRGRTRRLEQSFAAFEGWRDAALEEEERDRHKLDRQIVREEHWMRYGVTARRKRNERRVRELGALREKRRTDRRAQGAVKLTVSEAETSGKLVIEAIGVTKRWGERAIVKDLSLRIARGDRIGLVGPNGAGKTTLIGLLTGTLPPDAGTVRLGTNLDIVTLDQTRESIDPAMPLREAIADGRGDSVTIGGETRHVMTYLQDFLFGPEQARTPVGALSGGERGRLMLARALAKPSNLMVLDEPTNDLDLETLDLLQEMIADYPGTVLIVSHDRDFLDRTVSSVLAWESDGVWTEYAGGYTDMIVQRGSGVRARTVPAPGSRGPASTNPLPAPNPERSVPKRKMSFKHKHALETLPKEIEKLSAEIIRLETRLADAGLYARAPEEAQRFGAELTAKIAERERLETAWLELAIEAEALGER